MGKVVAASLWLNIFGELARECDQGIARYMTALAFAETAVLDGLEDLSLRAQDSVLRFRDVAVNHSGEGGIFFLLEAAGTPEFGLTVHDPGVGRLFSVKCLRFAMNYFTALFD